jgi:hypothetical protein
MIDSSQRITSVTDTLQGENPGQNTPAYTSQQMLQQGMAVFSGIFKRVYRSMRDEFRKMYYLNRIHLDPMEYFEILDGPDKEIYKKDYQGDPKDIIPAADPSAIMDEEKMRQAQFLAERSATVPGYNKPAVELKMLAAMSIPDVDTIYPTDDQGQPTIQNPPPPDFQMKAMEEQRRTMEGKRRADKDDLEARTKAIVAEAQVELLNAETVKTYAEAGIIDASAMKDEAETVIKQFGEQTKRLKAIGDIATKHEANQKSGNGVAASSGN